MTVAQWEVSPLRTYVHPWFQLPSEIHIQGETTFFNYSVCWTSPSPSNNNNKKYIFIWHRLPQEKLNTCVALFRPRKAQKNSEVKWPPRTFIIWPWIFLAWHWLSTQETSMPSFGKSRMLRISSTSLDAVSPCSAHGIFHETQHWKNTWS